MEDELAEYVVQRHRQDVEGSSWDDIATVKVPKRSWTRTVLFAALEQAGIEPLDALRREDCFRVLDKEAAYGHVLKVKEPDERGLKLA